MQRETTSNSEFSSTKVYIAPTYFKALKYLSDNGLFNIPPETVILASNNPISEELKLIKVVGEGPHKAYYIETPGHNLDNAGHLLDAVENHPANFEMETVYL